MCSFYIRIDQCKTETDLPCQFPFVYKEKVINGCTMEDHNEYWCSTGVTLTSNGKWWGNCRGLCQQNCTDSE